jgi:hypothetical protein
MNSLSRVFSPRTILNDLGKVNEKDIILAVNAMIENTPYSETTATGNSKESLKIIKASLSALFSNDFSKLGAEAAAEVKQANTWNYGAFVKVLTEAKKPNWTQVLKSIDSPEFYVSGKKAFAELLSFCDVVRDSQKISFPRELFVGKWENLRTQVNFIERFLELGKSDVSIYKDIKNKNLIDYDSTPAVRSTASFINSGMEVWLFKDFVTKLIELSDSYLYSTIKVQFE